ncbi:hypothetical protein ACIG5E_37585 [Kitasatospora sp. NPDC053057]|uniref:hypothetical protein n=1 Tax=Kitasatospora sp. NPDC053057 TaxID=3364062 RepID=UPI0037CC0098
MDGQDAEVRGLAAGHLIDHALPDDRAQQIAYMHLRSSRQAVKLLALRPAQRDVLNLHVIVEERAADPASATAAVAPVGDRECSTVNPL